MFRGDLSEISAKTATLVMRDVKLTHNMSTAHHPQNDGTTEKTIDIVESVVLQYVCDSANDWEHFLAGIDFAHNTSICKATRISPFRFTHGWIQSAHAYQRSCFQNNLFGFFDPINVCYSEAGR